MSIAKITLIGAIKAFDLKQEKLFDLLSFPEGIDKDTAINTIILNSGEFETLYADPDFMRLAIGHFSEKWYRTFNKWITALNLEYNPLWNKEYYEDETIDHTGTQTTANTGTQSTANTGTQTTANTGTQGYTGTRANTGTESTTHNINYTDTRTPLSGTVETVVIGSELHSVSAFDDTGMVEKELIQNSPQTIVSDRLVVRNEHMQSSSNNADTRTDNLLETINSTRTDNLNEQRTDNLNELRTDNLNEQRTDALKDKRALKAYGNIGVTTSQQLLESELDIAKWNLYNQIADIFTSEFCIMVY